MRYCLKTRLVISGNLCCRYLFQHKLRDRLVLRNLADCFRIAELDDIDEATGLHHVVFVKIAEIVIATFFQILINLLVQAFLIQSPFRHIVCDVSGWNTD